MMYLQPSRFYILGIVQQGWRGPVKGFFYTAQKIRGDQVFPNIENFLQNISLDSLNFIFYCKFKLFFAKYAHLEHSRRVTVRSLQGTSRGLGSLQSRLPPPNHPSAGTSRGARRPPRRHVGRPHGFRRLGLGSPGSGRRGAASPEPHFSGPAGRGRRPPHRCPRGGSGAAAAAGGREGWAPPERGAGGPRGRLPRGGSRAPPRRSGFLPARPPAAAPPPRSPPRGWARSAASARLAPARASSRFLSPLPLEPPEEPATAGRREDGGGSGRRRRGGRGPGRRGRAGVGATRAVPLRRGARGRRGSRARRAASRGGRRAAAADAPGAQQSQENPSEKPAPGQQLPGTGTGLRGGASRGQRGSAPERSCPRGGGTARSRGEEVWVQS